MNQPKPNQPARSVPPEPKPSEPTEPADRRSPRVPDPDELVDEASDESFPASDPPAWTAASAA